MEEAAHMYSMGDSFLGHTGFLDEGLPVQCLLLFAKGERNGRFSSLVLEEVVPHPAW